MRSLHEILAAVRRWRTQRAFAKAWATARTPKHPTPPTDARVCINCHRLCVHITAGSIPFCSIDNLPCLPDDTCDDFIHIPAAERLPIMTDAEPTPKTCATCAKAMVAGEGNGSHFLVCAYKRFGQLTPVNPGDTCPAYKSKENKQ